MNRDNITSTLSRFIRTTWLLSATKPLELPACNAWIRQISASESDALVEQTRKRNVFARHSRENSFYLKRAGQLAGATVLEVFRPGSLDQVLPVARSLAELVEKTAVVSSTLGLRRSRMHQMIALSRHRRYGFDLAISPGFRYLHSSQREEALPRGIPVNDTFVRRFNRCGFQGLLAATTSGGDIAKRLEQGVGWLFESRQETSAHAAVVKTAIALETLLIASDSESLRGPLSERASFLLSDDPARRRRIARSVKTFYDLRSGIVHGGRRRAPSDGGTLLEGIDRLVVLLLLTIGANVRSWTAFDRVVEEVENRKWGAGDLPIQRPYPGSHLSRALQLCEGKVRKDGA
jgi:hypothetical protein